MIPTLFELSRALLAVFEGPERLMAFRDAGGVLTIGRGHTQGVTERMRITPDQSAAFFASDCAPLFDMVRGKPLLAGAAYVSFGYNCGLSSLKLVLAGTDTITNPRHATDRKGVVEPGLVSRRALETLLIEVATSPPV